MNAPVPAPWVRTRLRAAPAAAAALAVLVALTACLAAAVPRAVDRYEDAGLLHAVRQARPDRTTLQITAPQPDFALASDRRSAALRPGPLGQQYERLLKTVPRALPVDRAQSAYGVRTTDNLAVPDPWLPRPSGLPARVALVAQSGVGAHAAVRAGRLPRAGADVEATTAGVEAAVTAATAESLHIEVGSVIHVPAVARAPLAVRITGILAPRDPAGAYWSTQPLLRTPALMRLPTPGPDPETYWLGALLLAPEAAPALLGTRGDPVRTWFVAPDTDRLRAHELGALTSAVAALEAGPALQRARDLTDAGTEITTDLDEVFGSFARLRSGIGSLVAVAVVGAGTVAVVVLLMAGGLAADRRRTELALLRARGASLRGLAGRLCAETAVVAVPAGTLGLAAALLALPEGRTAYAVTAAVAVTATACAALPLRAALGHRTVRVTAPREDVTGLRPSRRRTVAEVTLLVLAAAAVEALRRQGTSAGRLVSAAPVSVGLIAALVLVRVYPVLLRAASRPAARLRGLVAPLSLARAGRAPSASSVLPLLALLTALTTAAFGGSVLAGVADARDRAALLTVGADARVDAASPLPTGLAERVRVLGGVRGVAAVSIAYEAKPGDGQDSVPLVGVDPGAYGELAAGTDLGPFPVRELSRAPGNGVLPALASPSVATTYGTGPFRVRLEDGGEITVRIALVRQRTPAVPGADFLVVDRTGLDAAAGRPTSLLITGGGVDAGALRAATTGAGGGGGGGVTASVRVRSEERAAYTDSPLQSGAERVYAAAVAAGAGYAVLALFLALLRAAPERTALLARLRTMGLTRAAGRRLLLLESLPQSVLAAAGGTLTGWATIRLLSPGIELTTIALPTAQPALVQAELHMNTWSLTAPAVAVVATTAGVAGVQAWWTGRRRSTTELRAGDGR